MLELAEIARPNQLEEVNLIERAKKGEEEAFELIYKCYEKAIYKLAYKMLSNREDAYDVTQETFVRAFKAIGQTRPDLNLKAWLHCIAANRCRDIRRRRKRVKWVAWEPTDCAKSEDVRFSASHSSEQEYRVIRQEIHQEVRELLQKLPPNYRQSLVLYEYQGLSYQQIAQRLGITVSTVKAQIHRARNYLRNLYFEGVA